MERLAEALREAMKSRGHSLQGGLTLQALSRFNQLEELTSGAPQQTVVALWAVVDLLLVVLVLQAGQILMSLGRETTKPPVPKDEG